MTLTKKAWQFKQRKTIGAKQETAKMPHAESSKSLPRAALPRKTEEDENERNEKETGPIDQGADAERQTILIDMPYWSQQIPSIHPTTTFSRIEQCRHRQTK